MEMRRHWSIAVWAAAGLLFSSGADAKGKAASPPPPVAKAGAPSKPAGIKLFQRGRRPELLADGLQLPAAIVRGKLDRGLAATAMLGWLSARKGRFGLKTVDAETLPLRGVHKVATGFSLRFIQRHARLRIEEAELIALFDAAGALRSLSSSLVPTPALATRAELVEKDALKAAAKKFGDIDPLPRQGEGGLLIARDGPGFALAWQLPLRDHKTKEAFAALVRAAGKNKGQVLRAWPLETSAAPVRINDVGPGVTAALPGVLLLDDGRPTDAGTALAASSPPDWADAQAAAENFVKVRDFYAALGRNGWDDAGSAIVASIRSQACAGNAYWSAQTSSMTFCKASATVTTLEKALDIVGHELTHGVVGSTSKLTYRGESGGLNEHLADMFGSQVLHAARPEADSFVHGAGMSIPGGEPGRRYLDPHNGRWPQPETMAEVRAGRGPAGPFLQDRYSPGLLDVHILSGVPNRAIATAARQVGWEALGKLLYTVMTARLRADSTFADYRDQLADECRTAAAAPVCAAIDSGFDLVGVVGSPPAVAAASSSTVATAPVAAPSAFPKANRQRQAVGR